MNDKEIERYVNFFYIKNELCKYETLILEIMKRRQEIYPSEKNDKEWENYSDCFAKRWENRNNTNAT